MSIPGTRFHLTLNYAMTLLAAVCLPDWAVADELLIEAGNTFDRQFDVQLDSAIEPIEISISGGRLTGSRPGSEVGPYAAMLAAEFRLYPRRFVRRSGLSRIVICNNLAFNNQQRSAVPDFANHALYLDSGRGQKNRNYQQVVLHHEFFHIVDYRDDGLIYQDTQWNLLNPADFAYGRGGASVQNDSSQSSYRMPTQGFLTNYSTSGVEEDKAEIFAHLIVNPSKVASARQSDEVLDQKVATLKALLRNFSDDLSEDFWSKVDKYRERRSRRKTDHAPSH